MIPINDPELFSAALREIQRTVGRGYLGRVAQMFLATKYYGRTIPQIGDPVGISTGDLEKRLDDLYRKPNHTGPEKILILFEDTFKVESGKIDGNLTHASNIWRNNLNLQKGYMCYAPVAEFRDRAFLLASRSECPHLIPAQAGTLARASCALWPNARYRGEDHAKMFRKDPDSEEYFVHDPSDLDFYRPLVVPANGKKLPIAAITVALYYNSAFTGGREAVTIEDFLTDFDFNELEADAYFDDNPAVEAHAALIAIRKDLRWERNAEVSAPPLAPILPGAGADFPEPVLPKRRNARKVLGPTEGTVSKPPAGGHWWSAQIAVRSVLVDDGWIVVDVSMLGVGYDLKATKGTALKLIEVKSSVGPCMPSMTEREYKEAKEHGPRYVLAIVENFNPEKPITVHWVQNPAALTPTIRQTKEYYIPRSVWKHRTSTAP